MDEKAPSKSVVLRSFVPSLVLKAQMMLKFNSKEQFLDNIIRSYCYILECWRYNLVRAYANSPSPLPNIIR